MRDNLNSFSYKICESLSSGMKHQTLSLSILLIAILLSGAGMSVGVFTGFSVSRVFQMLLSSVNIYSRSNDQVTLNEKVGFNFYFERTDAHATFLDESRSMYRMNSCRRGEDFNKCHDDAEGRAHTPAHSFYDTSVSIRYKQRFTTNKEVKREAVAAMNIALDFQNQGKTEKAMKVFQHALALDPSHSDILTAFGEFLEWHIKDIVEADHMYHIALENSPEHGRALQNRQRTGPIVEEIDQALFSRVDQKRAHLYTIPHNDPALRRAKKEAYFSHIYHTNAIEGNTLTLAQTRAIVETRIAVGGKSLQEQNEVLGLDSALSFINSTLVGRVGKLTLQDILHIHIRVLGYVDPTEAGRFRTTQVYVGDFTPPAARDLRELMDSLVEWLNSEEALNLHPIEFAALAHFRLVTIHPFYDGNGRTSRLLMNLILMQAGFPPVSIEVNDRLTYYETLEQGNKGDIRPFIRFIAKCAERTLDGYLSVTTDESELTISPSVTQKTPKDRVIYVDNEFSNDEHDENNSISNDDGS